MYIKITGSNNLAISKSYKIICLDKTKKEEDEFTIVGKMVKLKLYGIEQTVNLKWLYTISFLGIKMPEGFGQYIVNIRFKKRTTVHIKSTIGTLDYEIVFNRPVYFSKTLRLVAENPRYAISEDKKIFDTLNFKYINFDEKEGKDVGYRYIRIFYPHLGDYKSRALHILAALTWIDNNDFLKYYLVNHKDGNKSNWAVKNLEWCNHTDNLIHAYKSGLRTDNRPVKIYDSVEKTIKIYYSVTEAFKSLGLNPRANLEKLFEERNGFYITQNRYEIRYVSDKNKFLLINNTLDEARKATATIFRKTYEAVNRVTKESIVGSNGTIQKALGISESAVTAIWRKKTFYNDWIIRDFTEDEVDFSLYKEVSNKPVGIVGFNIVEQKEYEFKSLREAGRIAKFDPKTIMLSMQNKAYTSGWNFYSKH